jgi:hypothetical protein
MTKKFSIHADERNDERYYDVDDYDDKSRTAGKEKLEEKR